MLIYKLNIMQTNKLHTVQMRQLCETNVKINCNWNITLCDNCGPNEVSVKSWNGPMSMFYAFTEGCFETWLVVDPGL